MRLSRPIFCLVAVAMMGAAPRPKPTHSPRYNDETPSCYDSLGRPQCWLGTTAHLGSMNGQFVSYYVCDRCKRRFLIEDVATRCAVVHGSDECCHKGQTE